MTSTATTLPPRFLSVGIEQGSDGAVLVHGFGVPGCVGYGQSPEEALEDFADRLADWLEFRESARLGVPPREAELEIAVDEWVRSTAAVGAGESDALFDDDLRPLSDREINEGLQLLGDLRGILLRSLRGLPQAEFDRLGAEEMTLRRIMDELARAQWWTLTRLGASPMAEVPSHPVGRLDTSMALVVQQFTALDGDARERSLELDGEGWTPRKVLRRLLWLEWSLGRAALHALGGEPVR
jgi:predicted RNase H-like HicB family nuclease